MHPLRVLAAALVIAPLSTSETIRPSPVSDCAQVTAVSKVTCPRDGGCCAAGECCAGGCCPIGAICINKGRGDEACCPLDDASTCGIALPTLTKVCDGRPASSVTCTAAETSWPCPPDSACGVRFGACFAIANTCTTTAGGVTPTPAPSGTSPTATGNGGTATTTSHGASIHFGSSCISVALGLGGSLVAAIGGFLI
ncbi:hypothetical protein QBC34DRAFT_411383 [Podospora aff. communis PSN243]|uniref:GPI anchored serine-threonine rich protein n=1 Tax=Podospora aff. communis PSN243 TaxID=3040156 RepID=A0AAV9GFT9_9PEZI|nr:hypothetical protein QBC34DRAFT_411383 [Podospora aff. communis PSN243]